MSRREAADPNAPKRLRCAIYTRKSSEEGLDQEYNSLHAQRDACEAYVKSQISEGWTALPTVYDDGGFSGGTMDRPGLKQLLADIDAGRIDVVVVYKVDRLTRALTDFARIVERFDAKGVSFVSVTQAFNTTTSMGRLTLNVLLSFAQFEREVTGERIRDKIAASKRKGMWMGGGLPLGYDPDGRTLKISGDEAELVQSIYRRYLQVGSVHRLADELRTEGVCSKRRVTKDGRVMGGAPITRGPLFYMLSNRTYRGEIGHKGEYFPGQHPAIVDEATFEAVQQLLLTHAGARRRRQAGLKPLAAAMPLAGKVVDDRGNTMSPVSARKGRGRLYRYYVSSVVLAGRKSEAGSLPRFPAKALETLVQDRLRRLELTPQDTSDEALWDCVTQVEVGRGKVVIHCTPLQAPTLLLAERAAALGDEVSVEHDEIVITAAVGLKARGRCQIVSGETGTPAITTPTVDLTLLKALVRAEAWKASLLQGGVRSMDEICTSEGIAPSYGRRMIRLAFLAPSLKARILSGHTPAKLTLQRLMTQGVPLSWREQLRQVG